MKKQKPSFEEALIAADLWCDSWQKEELSDEVLADRVGELLETKIGARAFFVISLSSENALMDRVPEPLLIQLRSAGENVVDLTVKNLAMSTAMAVLHKKKEDFALEATSLKIKHRCIELLRLLEPSEVKERLESLLTGLKGEGQDVEFINRWEYNNEQKEAITESIYSVAEH